MKDTYRAVVTREGGDWLATVEGLEGAHTYARNLPALRRNVAEVVVLADDLPDDALPEVEGRIDFAFETGDQVLDRTTADLRRDREAAHAATARLTAETERLARELVQDRGLSVRDVGVLLGIAPQRVSQLVGARRTA